MSKTEIEYLVEFRNFSKPRFHRATRGFRSRGVALDIAKSHKRESSELKVRVVEQTRRILEVL